MELRIALQERAALLSTLRRELTSRGAIEVITKSLLPEALAHPTTQIFSTRSQTDSSSSKLYLQASPELEMRRLIARGSGQIFQICAAYRDEQPDDTHDREFQMLEWYTPGTTYIELRQQVGELVRHFCKLPEMDLTCQDIFHRRFGVDLSRMSVDDLDQTYRSHLCSVSDQEPILSVIKFGRLLDKALSEIAPGYIAYVSNYPLFDTCFGKASANGYIERFEIFLDGVEIANGYQEIESGEAFLERFRAENLQRINYGLDLLPEPTVVDLPPCAGVAIGVDRLLGYVQRTTRAKSDCSFL
ncbi:amino acid--tRNA ligase-related protein [Bradyrhizobium sp. SZCCHNRI1009]|uniref:amino acid--tRNA ligase-related protein n=1 Tax=Bradyrhizobium sp. SZCCHNRI1009 TaxID=3057277 RepID=UPI002915D255|nr:amino acid--tRNA ligase-related protein [Bradyrhizobium sp. SZCCHNRI1009]